MNKIYQYSPIKDASIIRGKLMVVVTNKEVEKEVFKKTKVYEIFAIYTPGYWEDAESFRKTEEMTEQR